MKLLTNKFQPEKIVLGSGASVFLNWTKGDEGIIDVGVTQGDVAFTYAPTLEPIKARGVRGNVKGLQYVTESETKVKAAFLQWLDKDLITNFLLNAKVIEVKRDGTSEGGKGTSHIIRGNEDLIGACGDDPYIDDITIIGRNNAGELYRITVFNALPTSGFEAIFADTEVATEVEFTGHNDPNDPMTPPFEIEIFTPEDACNGVPETTRYVEPIIDAKKIAKSVN
ncbi:hypothetical protein [Bacillus sp. COPE52]|uniref:hypothetical protein n=1 Tax=Bacillus sp. COPE52 TaxID=2233998 RepID=UPI0021C48812|nr:hypothetical protein [Bacillus sp. COPE52]